MTLETCRESCSAACVAGKTWSESGVAPCSPCTECDHSTQVQKTPCTSTANAKCMPRPSQAACVAGKTWSESGVAPCSPCTECDHSTQVQKTPCTSTANAKCMPRPSQAACVAGKTWSESGVAPCSPCTECDHSTQVQKTPCTSTANAKCMPRPSQAACVAGKTWSESGVAPCSPCTECDHSTQVQKTPCTSTANAKCMPRPSQAACVAGKTWSESGVAPCSPCKPDSECALGVATYPEDGRCTRTSDTKCQEEWIPIDKPSNCKKQNLLYKECDGNGDGDLHCCEPGSVCFLHFDAKQSPDEWYAQCKSDCGSSAGDCCKQGKNCEYCAVLPEDSLYVEREGNVYLSKNTLWTRTEVDVHGKICCYPGGGELWYDNGGSCNETVCKQNEGQWVDDALCKKHFEEIKRLSSSNDFVKQADETYSLQNEIQVKSREPNPVVTVTSSGGTAYRYTLLSKKPKWWPERPNNFAKFDHDACMRNCKASDCESRCKPIKLTDDYLKQNLTDATTTNFAFGSSTACMCNGKAIMEYFKDHPVDGKYWVGVATPSWVQSPFDTTEPAGSAQGGSTVAWRFNEKYTSNCGNGPGGCGTCWELMNGSQNANAVVVDTCEDTNAYGNNFNWCVAHRPDTKLDQVNPGGTYSGHFPPFYESLTCASSNERNADGKMMWSSPECMDGDDFVCKNMAGAPLHFDFATQTFSKEDTDKMGIWPNTTNPRVKVRKIDCPAGVTEVLKRHCGHCAGSSTAPKYYCPNHSDDVYKKYWPKPTDTCS